MNLAFTLPSSMRDAWIAVRVRCVDGSILTFFLPFFFFFSSSPSSSVPSPDVGSSGTRRGPGLPRRDWNPDHSCAAMPAPYG